MHRLRAGLLLLLGSLSLNASALNLIDGHTGLYSVRSAFTLEQGSYAYGVWLSSEQYKVPGSTDLLMLNDASLSFHQGVTDTFEVGMYFPSRYGVGNNNLGMQHFGVSLKWRADTVPRSHDAVAFTLYGGVLAADPTLGMGSGQSNYGLSFDYSNAGSEKTIFHSNITLESSDGIAITGPAAATFAVESKMAWRMGGEYRYSANSSFNLGLELSSNLTRSLDSAMLLPSYTYRSSDGHLRYTVGVGYNMQSEADIPASSVYMGMNYTFDSARKKMSELETRISMLEGQVNNFTTSQQSQDSKLGLMDERMNYLYETDLPTYNQRVDGVEKQVAELQKRPQVVQKPALGAVAKPATKPMTKAAPVIAPVVSAKPMAKDQGMKVEIINRSGDKTLATRITQRLKKKGYDVIGVIEGEKSLSRSHVFYQKGFDKEAVQLGHALPKNQIVLRSRRLDADVHLRLELGSDLK